MSPPLTKKGALQNGILQRALSYYSPTFSGSG